jgi:hypothetical protein
MWRLSFGYHPDIIMERLCLSCPRNSSNLTSKWPLSRGIIAPTVLINLRKCRARHAMKSSKIFRLWKNLGKSLHKQHIHVWPKVTFYKLNTYGSVGRTNWWCDLHGWWNKYPPQQLTPAPIQVGGEAVAPGSGVTHWETESWGVVFDCWEH